MSSVFVFSIIWSLQHFCLEGVAFMLMQKGLGINSAKTVLIRALAWGVVTFIVQVVINKSLSLTSLMGDLAWSFVMLVFYFCLWVVPQKHLFRRPAAILYARFWFFFRLITMIGRILTFIPESRPEGECTYVYGSLLIFALCEPFVLYYTLLQDSRWWQGLVISQGRRDVMAEAIRSPLDGVDLNLKSAQSLAKSMDQMGQGSSTVGVVHKLCCSHSQNKKVFCDDLFFNMCRFAC